MKTYIPAVLAGLLLLPAAAHSEAQFKISTEIRQRLEVDGKAFDDTGVFSFNLLRTRLGAEFTASEHVAGFVQLQDSRVWGEEASTLGDGSADYFDLHQGYFVVDQLFDRPVDLKVGRMEFNLGPQRLIGAVDWHNVGRAFDGAMLRLRRGENNFNLFSFTEVDSLQPEDRKDRFVHGAFVNVDLATDYTTLLFWIWQRWVPREMLNRHTLGFYAARKGRFHHETEFAYQLGDITAMDTTQTVSALFAALSVGYAFPEIAARPDVTVGVDYLSGDDDATDDDYKVFDTMYATGHKYNGFMDYFLNVPKNTMGLGLVDAHGRLALAPEKRTSVKADYHYFAAAQDYVWTDADSNEQTSKSFGSEVDLTLAYSYTDNMTFTAGASVFVPGDIFKVTKGSGTANWFYLMTAFKME